MKKTTILLLLAAATVAPTTMYSSPNSYRVAAKSQQLKRKKHKQVRQTYQRIVRGQWLADRD
ncbi:hypothetical protein [Hymenobacter sp. GOD-10R]|uniref:hypothetical protein n=1 Tax=Hymenobacter sp. GOD-10R TaxID=3093922 RepID=UPI002D79F876|nr:hypothetical protein [Hymenobacter sp. GOD-10R]WRQ28251.1 hypothetical protein SD425_24600 [Hymenobacter sp. GOD-10R]